MRTSSLSSPFYPISLLLYLSWSPFIVFSICILTANDMIKANYLGLEYVSPDWGPNINRDAGDETSCSKQTPQHHGLFSLPALMVPCNEITEAKSFPEHLGPLDKKQRRQRQVQTASGFITPTPRSNLTRFGVGHDRNS